MQTLLEWWSQMCHPSPRKENSSNTTNTTVSDDIFNRQLKMLMSAL